jgi:hypothetical protein
MRTSLGTHAPRPRFPVTLASTAPVLPDLSRYNNPASANFDFIRGIRYGRLAASRAVPMLSFWDPEDETAALDLALETIPLNESMSFAFLKGFAAEFRHTYKHRFRAA